ncbi:hypothetical protein, partial [Enterobacter cloacae complex sp. 743-2DZ2F-22B]
MTMITPSYLGETIEYSSLHACRSTLEDPTRKQPRNTIVYGLFGGPGDLLAQAAKPADGALPIWERTSS